MDFLVDDLRQLGIDAGVSASAAGLGCLIVTSFTRRKRLRTPAHVPVGPPRLYAISGGRSTAPPDDIRPRPRESLRLVAGEFGA
jgi:hypothetical protein